MATLRRLLEAAGERLEITSGAHDPGVPRAATPEEHAQRLLDVLSVADALPARPRARRLDAPRLVSR